MPSKQSTPTKTSDPVYDLVHSMSRTEKRYFNINTQSIKNNKGKTPDYYILYEILDKMKIYAKEKAEQKLLKKLGKDGFSNFTVKKVELYDVLMKSLRNYAYKQTKKSADYIKVLIRDANFLFKRGLFKDAEKHLKEAKKLAKKCGDTLSLIEISRFERAYILTTRSKNMDEKLEIIHEESLFLFETLKGEEEIRRDYDLIYSTKTQRSKLINEEDIRKFKSKFSHLFEVEKNQNLSILSERYLINTLSQYHYLLEENELYLEKTLSVIDWWENNETWLNQSPHLYIAALSNLLTGYSRLGRYDEFLYILKKIEKIKPNNQYEEAMRFHRLMINRQVYFLNNGLIDEVCNLSSAIKKGIKNHKINEGVQIVLIFNVIVAFFVNKEYKECIKWVNLYNPFKKMKIMKTQIPFAQILKIISFYELEDLDELEQQIKSTEKYYDNDIDLTRQSLENIILRSMKRMSKVTPKEQAKIITELKITLDELPIKSKRRLGFDEIDLWVSSKIGGKTILQLLLERNK
jgi:hypothetical protein